MYYHTVQGKRESNEDQHFIFSNLDGKNSDKNNINMIGVFDGHGGKLVSKYLKENLPDYFTKKFKDNLLSKPEKFSKYVSKVFGSTNFSKPRTVVPLFVEETFQALLTNAWRMGYIRGLNCELTALPDARQAINPTSIAFYLEKYQSPVSPWVVSELRGNKVYNLFKFTTIADGDAANIDIKISLANMSFNNGTFDVLVRDFFDTDSAPVVLEKYTNCSMNPQDNSFIGKKIGSLDGEYPLLSSYIMVEMNEDAPIDAIP
jgi:hypothetical protein